VAGQLGLVGLAVIGSRLAAGLSRLERPPSTDLAARHTARAQSRAARGRRQCRHEDDAELRRPGPGPARAPQTRAIRRGL